MVQDFDLWGYSFDISSHGEIIYSVLNNAYPAGMGLNLADLEGKNEHSLIPIEDGVSYEHPRWSPDGSQIAFFARGEQYGSGAIVISSNRGEHLRVVAESVEIGRCDGNWATLTWMPDGEAIVYEGNGALYLFSIPDGVSQGLVSGHDPDCPSASRSDVNIDLLTRKEATIPQLEATSVAIVGIPFPIDAFDETAARALVQRICSETEGESLDPEHVDAFARVTLQEECLAGLLPLYSQTSADLTEVGTDIVGIGLVAKRKADQMLQGCYTSGNPFSGACLRLRRLIERKTLNIINSFGKVAFRFLPDPEQQKEFQEFWGLLMNGITLELDKGGKDVVQDILLGTVVKGFAVDRLVHYYVGEIQPSLDQGIQSADPIYAGSEPVWTVEDQVERAAIHTESLVEQATIEAEYAHSAHEDLMRGADMTKFITDIADIAQLSPWASLANIVSIVTRLEHLLIDVYALKVNLDSMTCTRYLSSRAGSLAFNPNQPGESCRDMNSRLPSLPRMARESERKGDVAAWRRAWLRVSDGSEIYDNAVESLLAAIRDGDDTTIVEALTNLDKADQILDSATGQATSVILNSDVLDSEVVEALSKSNQFSLNALELYLLVTSYVTAPENERVTATEIEQAASTMLSSLEEYSDALLAAAPTADESSPLPIIQAVALPDDVAIGEPFEVAIAIRNIGSANANEVVARLEIVGRETQTAEIGYLEASQVHTATLQVQAVHTGTLTLLTEVAMDGSITDNRIDQVRVRLESTEETSKPRTGFCLGGAVPLLIVVALLFAGQKATWSLMR